jgi:hypothetical protein
MSRESGTSAERQQPKTIVQARRQPFDPEGVDAAGCQLDCERNPVEPPADIGDNGRIRVAQLEPVQTRCRSLDEELHGRKAERVVRREARR